MSIHLYQIQYDDQTKPSEESGFIGFDVRDNPEFLKREMAHMMRFYDEIVSLGGDDDFYGLFSPKFNEKTGLGANDVVRFIDDNFDADVCLFNPYPMLIYKHLNVWQQGEECQPGLIRLATQMFKAAGSDFDPASLHRNSVENTVYCNYWVAKKTFFDIFIPFVKSMDRAIDEMPTSIRSEYFSDAKYISKACYYPFLFERLLSAFLVMHPVFSVSPFFDEDRGNIGRVERSFLRHGGFRSFDNWERERSPVQVAERLESLQKILNPSFNFSFFLILQRLLSSLLKTYYVLTIKRRV